MMVRSLIGGMVVMLLAAPSQAAPLLRHGTFVFSGLCGDPHSGRMIGSRLTVVRLEHYDVTYYEWSDLFEPGKVIPIGGQKPSPSARFGRNIAPGLYGAAAAATRIEASGHMTADFDPDNRNPPKTVVGELSEEGFMLSGFEARIWLPRQRDLGAKIPLCDLRPPKLPMQ